MTIAGENVIELCRVVNEHVIKQEARIDRKYTGSAAKKRKD